MLNNTVCMPEEAILDCRLEFTDVAFTVPTSGSVPDDIFNRFPRTNGTHQGKE